MTSNSDNVWFTGAYWVLLVKNESTATSLIHIWSGTFVACHSPSASLPPISCHFFTAGYNKRQTRPAKNSSKQIGKAPLSVVPLSEANSFKLL